MASALVIGALTWLHVLGAMGWFGGDLVLMIGLDPRLGRLSPSARWELTTRILPGINVLEMAFSGTTVTFGLLLLIAVTNGNASVLSPSNSWGLAVTVGAALAFVAFLLEVGVHSPAVRRMIATSKALGQQSFESMPAEISKHARRSEMAETVIVVLLFAAFTCMIASGQL